MGAAGAAARTVFTADARLTRGLATGPARQDRHTAEPASNASLLKTFLHLSHRTQLAT